MDVHLKIVQVAVLMVGFTAVSGTNFRVSPPTINIDGADPTTKLTLTCSPDSPGITTLYSIVIGKLGQNNADSDIVRINSQGITVIDTSYGQRLRRTGSVSGTNGNLVLEISSLICSDAASFYCKTIFDTATEVAKTERANVNVTARTYPGEIMMTVDPDFSVYSNTPVSVTFKCYGDNIGNQYIDNQASLWQWQSRTFKGNWINYPDTSNITYRTPSAGTDCQYSGGTDLVHTVTSADNGKQFRCYALTSDYSANKTVYTEISGTNFRVSPPTINIDGADPTTKLTLTCSPDSPGITTLYSIVIGKLGQNNADSDIVRINSRGITVIDTSYGQRLRRTGSVSGTNGNLVLEISSLICSDAASFYCKTVFDTATEVAKIERANVNVTARTYPGEITMTVDPDFSVYSNTPVSVTFKCYGDNIGNQYIDKQASLWQWQTRTFNGNWINYPDTSNIAYRTPSTGTSCQYSGGTDLVHTVTSADNGKQFRCYALTPDYSANKTVYTEDPTTLSPGGVGDAVSSPTDFFCTDLTGSSVQIQWIYNGTKTSLFTFHLLYRLDKDHTWNTLNTDLQNRQVQSLHTISVLHLQSDSLYYFRLYADVGAAIRSNDVVVTCSTKQASGSESCSSGSAMGIGVAIGVGAMLLIGGLGIVIVFINRRKTASCLYGESERKHENVRLELTPRISTPETETTATKVSEYEVPGHFYDALQGTNENIPNACAKLSPYQNTGFRE